MRFKKNEYYCYDDKYCSYFSPIERHLLQNSKTSDFLQLKMKYAELSYKVELQLLRLICGVMFLQHRSACEMVEVVVSKMLN